jgi:UDP-N-acetylglucosamine 2-epimerase (non-hydrolysing)
VEILSANECKKVLVVIGTRPEAIKLAPIVLELERPRGDFKTEICVTGQQREMLENTRASANL